MRSILENVSAYDFKIKQGLVLDVVNMTLGATFNMAADMPPVLEIDCGAAGRTVVLPSITNGTNINGRTYLIRNVGASNSITLNAHADDSSTNVATLEPGASVLVTASLTKLIWYAIVGTADVAFLAGVTAGTVTASKVVVVDASKNIGTFGTITAAGLLSTTASVTTLTATNLSGTMTIADSSNLAMGTTTGSQIGTATNQKIGFFAATPIVQPTSANQAAAATTAVTTAATTTTPWGYASSTQANNLATEVAAVVVLANELRLQLVNLGLIKGS